MMSGPVRGDMTFQAPGNDAGMEGFVERCCESFLAHGAVVINDVIPAPYLAAVNRAYAEAYGNTVDARREVGDKRTMIAIRVEPPFSDPALFAPAVVLPVLQRLLGGNCILDAYVAVTSRPESPDQHVHVDFPFLFDEDEALSQSVPAYAITLAIPLVPVNAMTGVTRVWPGTHRSRIDWKNVQPDLMNSVAVAPDFGGCYLFDARLVHSGTANYSPAERPILYLIYCRPWWRDSTNFYHQKPLLISRETLASFPEPYRAMFRYAF
jgi:hypothetical protein